MIDLMLLKRHLPVRSARSEATSAQMWNSLPARPRTMTLATLRPCAGHRRGIVAPAQSTNIFSPALCSWHGTTSSFERHLWYR
jgi:hypothetical protein